MFKTQPIPEPALFSLKVIASQERFLAGWVTLACIFLFVELVENSKVNNNGLYLFD